jgi:DNA-binding beta-propeller fold protein YncE
MKTTLNREGSKRPVWLKGAGFALICTALLSGCAPTAKVAEHRADEAQLVYPAPPDEPRFVFERTISGSADIVDEEEASLLKRTLTGQSRTSEVLGKPYAVSVYKGKIFVSDSTDRFIKVFDVGGGAYYKIGDAEGDGQLNKPLGIDVDQQGKLYVADAGLKSIMVFDKDGKFLRKIAGPKFFDRLSSVSVDPAGDRLYVVDIGGVKSEQHRVRVFNAKDGSHLFDIGKRGSANGEFNLPRDTAIGKDGRIYVVDGGNFRVQVFDKDGKYLKSFGAVGKQLGNFARPKEVATDRDGNVYVVDAAFGNFQIFTPEGELLMFVGERSEKEGPGRYMLPSGIAVDEDGRIYFVDQWFRKIDIFRPFALKAADGFLVPRPKPPKTAGK